MAFLSENMGGYGCRSWYMNLGSEYVALNFLILGMALIKFPNVSRNVTICRLQAI